MNKRLKNDLFLILALLSICLIIFMVWVFNPKKEGKKALVYHNEELIMSIDLYKNQTVYVEGDVSSMTIVVNYGKIYVKESGCYNQICVHMGEKSMENETITCLPNHITIIIKAGDNLE